MMTRTLQALCRADAVDTMLSKALHQPIEARYRMWILCYPRFFSSQWSRRERSEGAAMCSIA